MKPKFFLGMLLLGGLALNSCVDDTESASVQEVRQAYAEKLQSLADLKKAQGEAEVIIANAEKAAQEAIDNYNRAQAKVQEAEAAYQQALAEQNQALAEQEKINLQKAQMDLANYAKEVEKRAAELEYQLIKQQQAIVEAKKDLEDKIKECEPDKAKELQDLLTAYTKASTKLIDKQRTLAQKRIELAQYKAGIVSADKIVEKEIADLKNDISTWVSENEAAQKQIETYEQYTDIIKAQEALTEAKAQKEVLEDIRGNKYAAYQLLNMKQQGASNTLSNSAYVQNVNKLAAANQIEKWSFGWLYFNNVYGLYAKKTGKDPIALFTTTSKENIIEYSYVEGQKVNEFTYWTYSTFDSPVKDGFAAYEKAVKADIAANQGAKLTAKQSEYTVAETAQKAAASAKASADAVLKAAKDAVEAAGNNVTEAQKQAVKDAEGEVAKKEAALTTANSNLTTADNAVKTAQKALDDVNKQLADNKALYDTAVADVAANEANIKAYNEALQAQSQAYVDYRIANNNYNLKASECTALENILNDPYNPKKDITSEIAALKEQIKTNNGLIATANAQIAEKEAQLAAGETPDQLIDIQEKEAEIAQLETEVNVLQKKVDLAKAALDAAMAEDAPAE